jgi:hypothetical protein
MLAAQEENILAAKCMRCKFPIFKDRGTRELCRVWSWIRSHKAIQHPEISLASADLKGGRWLKQRGRPSRRHGERQGLRKANPGDQFEATRAITGC